MARRGGGQSRGGSERASERARRKETVKKEERKGRLGVGHGRRGGVVDLGCHGVGESLSPSAAPIGGSI